MPKNKTRARTDTPSRARPAAAREVRALNISVNFSAVFAAVFNAMHEEAGAAGGSSWEFQEEAERRFRKALDKLEPLQPKAREDALADLVTASMLYWCLRGSLDRTQKFTAIRDDLRILRDRLARGVSRLDEAEEKLVRKGGKKAGGEASHQTNRGDIDVSYERDFLDEWDIRTSPLVVDGVVRSRLFELKVRQFLRTTLRRLDAVLAPANGLNVRTARGQPRKYSKDFLLLRSIGIFRKYGQQSGVTRWKESNKKRASGPAYSGALVDFVKLVLGAVDPTVDLGAKFGIGKSIEEANRLMKRVPNVDKLVRQNSSDRELLRFAVHCDGIRAKPGR
jgi:hypothetical protein